MKTVKRIFLYSVLVILIFYVFLVDINVEGQLAISAFAQNEREIIFEEFDTRICSAVDTITDIKIEYLVLLFDEPIYMVIYGHTDFHIRFYSDYDYLNFSPDATHLIRVGDSAPFSLNSIGTNCLTPKRLEEGESVISALVRGEEIKLRYYVDRGDQRNKQVDTKIQNVFLGFVYNKAANLFGWKDLGVSSELPPIKFDKYAPSRQEVGVSVQWNPDLKLVNYKGQGYASIVFGGREGFGINGNGEWICDGTIYQKRYDFKIYNSDGMIVYKGKTPGTAYFEKPTAYQKACFGDGRWPEGETAAKKVWEAAPLGTIVFGGKRINLYGFRELWQWGVDNLNFPSVEPISSPQVFLSNSQWDLGLISQGDLPTFAFTIENKGELNLVINKIDASEYVQYDVEIPLNILPAEKQEVIFTYDSRQHDLGEVLESIRIYCNDPRKNAFSLRIKGYIKEKSTPTESISPVGTETTYFLKGSLHCPDTSGYPCDSCGPPPDYINHFKGFNVLTTNEDCYVKLTYNDGDYIGNQNSEVTIKGEKWLGLEYESGTKLVEEINKGNFDFTSANKFVERTMIITGDGYNYEFANNGKEFRLYLSRNREEAFKAVPWKNITVEIKNKETDKVFKYKFSKGIFPQAYSWSNGVANYGQCVWWTAKRWVEEVDSKTLFPFYPPSPEAVDLKTIDSNYRPKKHDVLINYDPGGPPEHYGFVEKVDGDKMYISQFNWIKPGEVYNYVLRTWNGKAANLFYSNNFYDEYYFKYYYRK